MPRGPFDPKIDKQTRKRLFRRLREVLAGGPLNMREIAAALAVEPETVVPAMRELRARRGTVRSKIHLGHVAWWWEPPTEALDKPTAPPKSKRRKKRQAAAAAG
jgi:hypothetical protein